MTTITNRAIISQVDHEREYADDKKKIGTLQRISVQLTFIDLTEDQAQKLKNELYKLFAQEKPVTLQIVEDKNV